MAGEDGKVLSLLQEFVLPPESVQEQFQGLPTLYNPPSVVRGLRKYPLQEAVSHRSRSRNSSRRGGRDDDDGEEESLQESDAYMYNTRESHTNLKLSAVIKGLLLDIAYHPGVKYWIAFFAVVIMLELGTIITNIIWFGLGAGLITIINQALWGPEEEDEDASNDSSAVASTEVVGNTSGDPNKGVLSGSYWKSQGWMLTLPSEETKNPFPDYDAFSFHLRNTKTVFIRLNGPTLLISFPHPRHRIPKRRLWNDPLISNDIIFIQHQHYNMYGAKVEIVPGDLPQKRCWSKKYPISITLACKDRHVAKLTEKVEIGNPEETDTDNKENTGVKVAGKGVKLKGEVRKEEGKCSGKILYLFARTDREKDDWFRRLVAASKRHASHSKSSRSPLNSPDFTNFISYMKHACPTLHIPLTFNTPAAAEIPNNNNRSTTSSNTGFETVLIPNINPPNNPSPPKNQKKSTLEHIINPSRGLMAPQFLNALLARLFYDFLRSPKWTHEVKQLIDKKLFFLRKPKFVQSLLVKELDLGNSLPVINHASSPVLDRQGLWVDLDITYTATVVITIEAFINLLNIGKSAHDVEQSRTGVPKRKIPFKSRDKFESDDDDDSGESSESEDDLVLDEAGGKLKPKESESQDNRGKIYKYADAIAKSSVMRNKHVQKVVGNLAATPFLLTVEVKYVAGSVAVNIPPVPNDRVWIGFRTNPEIDINAKPKVGQRVVSFSQVTGWIKKKLLLEFQRVMVCPNMVDVAIPFMDYELPK